MRAAASLVILCAVLSGCSWTRGVSMNSTQGEPQFTFTNQTHLGFGAKDEAVCLAALTLSEAHPDDPYKGGEPQWQIVAATGEEGRDCANLSGVTYAQLPEGFIERVAPRDLAAGRVYYLRYETVGGYPNVGERWFCLDEKAAVKGVRWEDGAVRVCKE